MPHRITVSLAASVRSHNASLSALQGILSEALHVAAQTVKAMPMTCCIASLADLANVSSQVICKIARTTPSIHAEDDRAVVVSAGRVSVGYVSSMLCLGTDPQHALQCAMTS